MSTELALPLLSWSFPWLAMLAVGAALWMDGEDS